MLNFTLPSSTTGKLFAFEPLWILLLTPIVLLPGRVVPLTWQPFFVIALFLYWPLYWIIAQRWLPPTPLNVSLTIILVWLPVNWAVAVDKVRAWQALGELLVGITFFVALIRWPFAQKWPQLIACFFLLLSLGLTVLGPIVMSADLGSATPLASFQMKLQPIAARLGESINPNILAGGLALALPLQVALSLNWHWTAKRWLPVGIGSFGLATLTILLLTLSRGADLAVAVALSVIFLLRWPRLLYLMPFILVGIILGGYWQGVGQLLNMLSFNAKLGGMEGRIEIWTRAIYALQDFVFTGIGIGTFNLIIPQLYPYISIPAGVDIPHAHNLLLQIGVDLGLPSLIAYLALLINVFVMLISVLRQRMKTIAWTLAAGTVGALIAMLLHGMVDAPLWDTKLAFMPWLLYALATLLYHPEQPPVVHPVVE